MKNLAWAAAALVLAAVPAAAQTSTSQAATKRAPARTRYVNNPSGGSPGYQENTYGRLPSPRTPTDVGNMAFPDPSQTPAGDLRSVPVGR